MAGGSRYGAGRPGYRVSADRCIALDVRKLDRAGALVPNGRRWRLTFPPDGGVLCLEAGLDAVRVVSEIDGTTAQRLPLKFTPCNYGGTRPWFCCPSCGRGCAVLYLRGGAFKCRKCAKVAHGCQHENAADRARRRAHKAAAKLGPDGAKPKGMRWATYWRLRGEAADLRARAEAAWMAEVFAAFPHLRAE